MVPAGRCAACARTRETWRGSARARGYNGIWEGFRVVFIGLLVAAGIAPVCGATLPDGPKTQDSECRRLGLQTFASADGSSLHLDHDPPLQPSERRDASRVCDAARIQLLCASCHARRLRETAVEGPPFCGLMLDLPTIQCLAEGVVNARAEVSAKKFLEEYELNILGK